MSGSVYRGGGVVAPDGTYPRYEVEELVEIALRARLADDYGDTIHLKSKHVCRDLKASWRQPSSTRVGHALRRLAERDDGLVVEQWTSPNTTPIEWEVRAP